MERIINYLIIAICSLHCLLNISCNDIQIKESFCPKSVKIYLCVDVESFDGDSRANEGLWENNDKIFLRFSGQNGIATGTATFNSESNEWEMEYKGNLFVNEESDVEVFFANGKYSANTDNQLALDPYTDVYQDKTAKYYLSYSSVDENVWSMIITANLKPITSRLRFTNGDEEYCSIKGIKYYSNYDVVTGAFTVRDDIKCDRLDKYIYGWLDHEVSSLVYIVNGDYSYYAELPSSTLKIGECGYMSVPSEKSHEGWNCKQVYGCDVNDLLWVDLGLPSGNIWAYSENIGANAIDYNNTGLLRDYIGNEYQWGATEPYTENQDYIYSTSTSSIQGTSNDIAHITWGGDWLMPTQEDYLELEFYCPAHLESYVWRFEGEYINIKQCIFMGLNGAEIVFPSNKYGLIEYWTASALPAFNYKAYCVNLTKGVSDPYGDYKYNHFLVRAIMKK